VAPIDFIPIAEETGVIVEIGAFVLECACRAALRWPSSVRVAVNLSSVQFDRGDLFETVNNALRVSGLPPERLELEITESILIGNTSEVIAKLSALRGLGVHIALDDFGTGYSSLSYLNDFEFDKIKVDQSFVRDINKPNASKASSIIRAVNAIARDFQMTIVVEGVETEDQLAALRQLGVSQAQGYLFSRPLSAEDMGVMLLREFAGNGKFKIGDAPPGAKTGAA
jgi:EAL domain-containing protein (putative c-di-GMP-specific phosphodiesterase class I)